MTKQISVTFIDINQVFSETGIFSSQIGAGYRHLIYNLIMILGMIFICIAQYDAPNESRINFDNFNPIFRLSYELLSQDKH